jgi:hypothetical protein
MNFPMMVTPDFKNFSKFTYCPLSEMDAFIPGFKGKALLFFLLCIDGTGLMLGKNSLNGNTYDWPKMYQNIFGYTKK